MDLSREASESKFSIVGDRDDLIKILQFSLIGINRNPIKCEEFSILHNKIVKILDSIGRLSEIGVVGV